MNVTANDREPRRNLCKLSLDSLGYLRLIGWMLFAQ
jgi:hypothetical protein